MKRLHVHRRVDDLARSIDFYTALFGSAPSLVKHDYAKWQIDEPRVNFAISKRSGAAGLDHLGIQVDDGAELTEVAERLSSFGAELVEQKDAHCCYAHSDKAWARDAQGISWDTFLTHGDDRTRVVEGQSVSVRVALGGRRIITKKRYIIDNNISDCKIHYNTN